MNTKTFDSEKARQKKQKEFGITFSFQTHDNGVTTLHTQCTPQLNAGIEAIYIATGMASASFQIIGEAHFVAKPTMPIQLIIDTAKDRIEMNGAIKHDHQTHEWSIKWNYDKDRFYA